MRINVIIAAVLAAFVVISGCKKNKLNLKIGDKYKGGVVFYIYQPGDPGYDADKQHGLIISEVAPTLNSGKWEPGADILTGATGTALGTGKTNTEAIVAALGQGDYAANVCDQFTDNGYSDWFLPSKDELVKLYEAKETINAMPGIAILENYSYFSSTETSLAKAYAHDFWSNIGSEVNKTVPNLIRPIRYF